MLGARDPKQSPFLREARVPVLVVDPDFGIGYVGQLSVQLRPGRGRVECQVGVSTDARDAAQTAIAATLGEDLDHWNVSWTVVFPGAEPGSLLVGDSLGLPLAVAVRAAFTRQAVPPDTAFTGRVVPPDQVSEVGYLGPKIEAAVAAKLVRLWLPNEGEVPTHDTLELCRVSTLAELWLALWPGAPRRAAGWRGALLAAVVPVLVLGVFAPLDLAIGQGLLGLTGGRLPAAHTTIVLVAERAGPDTTAPLRERRDEVAELVDRLVRAKVRSLSFDLAWSERGVGDAALARSLRAAVAADIPVVMTLRWPPEAASPTLPRSEALAALLSEGLVRPAHALMESERHIPWGLGRIVLFRHGGAPWPGWLLHAAGETVASWSPGATRSNAAASELVLGTSRNPTPLGRLTLRPVAPTPCWRWAPPGSNAEAIEPRCPPLSDEERLAGRAVWIGTRSATDERSLFGEVLSGVELDAAATEVIAAGRAPDSLRLSGELLTAAIAGVLGLLWRRLARPRWVAEWGALALGVVALAAAAALDLLVPPSAVLLPLLAVLVGRRVWPV